MVEMRLLLVRNVPNIHGNSRVFDDDTDVIWIDVESVLVQRYDVSGFQACDVNCDGTFEGESAWVWPVDIRLKPQRVVIGFNTGG